MTIEAGWVKDEELQKGVDNASLNPEEKGQEGKTYSEEEYKNAQAFGTKAQQERIKLAEKLVAKDPKELELMDDIALQNKVINNLYGASDLDELKILKPELFSDAQESNEGEDDELAELQKKVKIMEYKATQWIVNNEIESITKENKDLVDTIPDFDAKIKEELKYISSEISPKERVQRAFRLVAWSNNTNDAYLALQGKTTKKDKKSEADKTPAKESLSSEIKELLKF